MKLICSDPKHINIFSLQLLIVLLFQIEDSGQYRCTARNEKGEVNLIMNLDVSTDISVGEFLIKTNYLFQILGEKMGNPFTVTPNVFLLFLKNEFWMV